VRKVYMAGSAVALALGLVGLVKAGDDTHKYDMKSEAGSCEGAIVKLFKSDKLVEFKVEKCIASTEKTPAPAPAPTPKDDEKRVDDKRCEGVREGQVVFLHVADARIIDAEGKELKREDKSSWFSRDSGWSSLKDGLRLRVEYSGTTMIPAPEEFPSGARTGGDILVYKVETIHILGK
jgi:hypothetical protein